MSTTILRKIKKVEKDRQKILSQILERKEMVRGSFCQIFVKCGKKNCWCATGKGHSHWRMSLREGGKSFSRAVPSKEYAWIEEMTNNYSEYRNMRKELQRLDLEIKQLLDLHEKECIDESKKGKTFLEVGKKVSEEKSRKCSETKKQVVS